MPAKPQSGVRDDKRPMPPICVSQCHRARCGSDCVYLPRLSVYDLQIRLRLGCGNSSTAKRRRVKLEQLPGLQKRPLLRRWLRALRRLLHRLQAAGAESAAALRRCRAFAPMTIGFLWMLRFADIGRLRYPLEAKDLLWRRDPSGAKIWRTRSSCWSCELALEEVHGDGSSRHRRCRQRRIRATESVTESSVADYAPSSTVSVPPGLNRNERNGYAVKQSIAPVAASASSIGSTQHQWV